ncbi:MAG: DUF1353 domain-containing protein [Ilumatobacteraceae bacterium]
MSPVVVPKQRYRFYDGGDPGDADGSGAEPADPTTDVLVVLDRKLKTDDRGRQCEVFLLRRRIAYDDRHCGEIIVPPAYESFESDLVSVPALFTWLVPQTGAHLPAALLHDGLVWDRAKESPTYISTEDKDVDRVEADRVFRDAMADTGTGLVRRWLVWTAVTLATMWSREETADRPLVRTYYRWIVAATLVVIGWTGYVATADLFDRTDRWWLTYDLPWMGDHSLAWELLTGAAGAVVIPTVIGLLWGRFRRAGWIFGIGIGVLIHVTIALLAVTALYTALEWSAGKLSAFWLRVVALAVGAAAVVLFVLGLR